MSLRLQLAQQLVQQHHLATARHQRVLAQVLHLLHALTLLHLLHALQQVRVVAALPELNLHVHQTRTLVRVRHLRHAQTRLHIPVHEKVPIMVVDRAVVRLLFRGELHVNNRLFFGRNGVLHVLLQTTQHELGQGLLQCLDLILVVQIAVLLQELRRGWEREGGHKV